MLLKSNITDLKKILTNDSVLAEKEERYCYAQDSTNTRTKTSLPDAVVFVESIEQIQDVLKYANKNKIPVISRGAGTNMVGACTCQNGGIILNFSRMNKILDFDADNMTMKVQSGVVVGDIKALAESNGLYFPPDPSNYKVSTIGGGIAQSSGGAKSFKYGTMKDYVLGMKVVLADGTVMQIGSNNVKDAVGYHLAQLMVGSEGTLAIIAEADLKLIPKPEANALVTGYFDSIAEAVSAVNSILKSGIFPSTIDFMDRNSINCVEKFYPSGLNTEKECMLLIEAEGFSSSLEDQVNRIDKTLKNTGASQVVAVYDESEKEKIWTARRASYAAVTQLAPDVVTDDIIVPRSVLGKMVSGCKDICTKYNLTSCIVGHIGDGNIHPQIALNLNNDEEFKNYMNAKSEMYKLALSMGGNISAEHGIGIEKLNYIKQSLDSYAIEYMKRIKQTFDPSNILNPGKIFKI